MIDVGADLQRAYDDGYSHGKTDACRWTPCSEQLPKKIGDYLVTTHNGQIARYIYLNTDTSKEYWKRCVLAWMPLPEPYQAEHYNDCTDCIKNGGDWECDHVHCRKGRRK